MTSPIIEVQKYGQSIWYDFMRRSLITSGELQQLVEKDGIRGITSNPAIFEKAINGSTDYDEALKEIEHQRDMDAKSIYEHLAISDIQSAADVLEPVYKETSGRDGYVSLEVSPYLAHDTNATIDEARRLWKTVNRKNLMVKVPATPEGTPAIRQLISEGINVNVTLLFSISSYEAVARAYIEGLKALIQNGQNPSSIASVASFFISRIDAAIDKLVEIKLKTASADEQHMLKSLLGRVAIANGKLAYKRYKEMIQTPEWKELANKGARPQRLLWASTGTKNPNYSDVMYVEELIGPDTVNTIPTATLEAFRNHGRVRATIEENTEEAKTVMNTLESCGISIQDVTRKLLSDGVRLFEEPFDKLLSSLEKRRVLTTCGAIARQTNVLSEKQLNKVNVILEEWRKENKVRKLWARDASLWTGNDESNWLGWLNVSEDQLEQIERFNDFAIEIKTEDFSHILLLGMGGSSLFPEMLRKTFGKTAGYPELHVLDSTDPGQIKRFESMIDYEKTLFIVSSKSGTTLEPNILMDYFFDQVKQRVGSSAGNYFVAITDPGSKLQQLAQEKRFRHVFLGWPTIGGRYSALSDFGMIPAAAMGLDVKRFLDRADCMLHGCAASVPLSDNPGVVLGTTLGALYLDGRDKVTIITSPSLSAFGTWLEQLLAESTGKNGKGLIPVDQERLGPPRIYGNDRIFVYISIDSERNQTKAVEELEKAGHPVIRISLSDTYQLGEEIFRWEMATAVAGSIIEINPFNQPDVEASKIATRELVSQYEKTGSFPSEDPIFQDNGVKLFTDVQNKSKLGQYSKLSEYFKSFFNQLSAGDYIAILSYLDMNDTNEKLLQDIRHTIRDARQVATCLEFGPRFLHSTGQIYKGGPNTGVFLQITCDDAEDIPVPGRKYTFGAVKAAQALGDFQILLERGRRALRVHLSSNVSKGLESLKKAIAEATT